MNALERFTGKYKRNANWICDCKDGKVYNFYVTKCAICKKHRPQNNGFKQGQSILKNLTKELLGTANKLKRKCACGKQLPLNSTTCSKDCPYQKQVEEERAKTRKRLSEDGHYLQG